MRIVILDGHAANPGDLTWAGLGSFGQLVVYDRTPPEAVVDRIGEADAVFTNKTVLDAAVLKAVPNLRFIGVLATGYNVVDIDVARELGIVVTNIPSYSTQSVAQLTIALLLEICHHVGAHSEAVRSGAWATSPDFCFWRYPLIELAGKTMGIVGFGQTGRATARIAEALGMEVIAYHPRGVPEETSVRGVGLDQLFAEADVVSLHCPHNDETEGIIRAETIAKMKPGVIILNTARGGLVVEADLAEALESGRVAAAGVDVLSTEPPAPDNPLLSAPNCIITPHFAWAPKEARVRLLQIAADNLAGFINGCPQNVV